MFELAIWNLKAWLYRIFRHQFPVGWIHRQEMEALRSLYTQIPISIDTVADLGTGNGDALQVVPSTTLSIGIDYAEQMLRHARSRFPSAQFVVADALHVPVRSCTIDVVLTIGLTEYFDNPQLLLEEIERLLVPHGYAIISFSPPGLFTNVRRLYQLKIYPRTFSQMKECIMAAGFEICDSTHTLMQQQVLIKKRDE